MQTRWLVLTGIAVHLIFFYSIFDIYFTSPLVHGMTPVLSNMAPPGKRLLLFVADGLRADKLFELDDYQETRAPYLRNIIESKGAWGVSHTRVPTESRPGHVALIAGFYEDVSAVAKGWKENPVEFDSVFNESRYTWSWGSPDILPMFSTGASGNHVNIECYPPEEEDFGGSNSSLLDTWVFDKVKVFLEDSVKNSTLYDMLHKDKIIFFLHLLGLDTNGHSHRPYSDEYLNNIKLVDAGVQEIVALFENFYNNDGKSVYVLTSDHGMTNWVSTSDEDYVLLLNLTFRRHMIICRSILQHFTGGYKALIQSVKGSHGAGDPEETLTPIIAWGSGIRGPIDFAQVHRKYADNFSNEWKLSHIGREDIEQADVAMLMAASIGVNFPMNSVGLTPIEYFSLPEEWKANTLLSNAQQMINQYMVKMEQKKDTTLSFAFKPFKKLTPTIQTEYFRKIRYFISNRDYRKAIDMSHTLVKLALEGLHYYHSYDKIFLGLSISLGFLGWMSYLCVVILQEHTTIIQPRKQIDRAHYSQWKSSKGISCVFIIIGIVVVSLLAVQRLPWTYYLYCLLPVFLWMLVFKSWETFVDMVKYLLCQGQLKSFVVEFLTVVASLEMLVYSFFLRSVLSLGLASLAVWGTRMDIMTENKMTGFGWIISCLLVAWFPIMPVIGREKSYGTVIICGITFLFMGLLCYSMLHKHIKNFHSKYYFLMSIQVVLIILSIYLVHRTDHYISLKVGIPVINQVLSWIILGMTFILPLLSSTNCLTRLHSVTMTFSSVYFLLSISYESAFLLSLIFLLSFWILMEYRSSCCQENICEMDFNSSSKHTERRNLDSDDIRRAYFFIFLLLCSFFGTGNIASINSFDPASVYCFLTVFNPFIMGALMMLKNLIPMVLVTSSFQMIHHITAVPITGVFLVVLLMCDVMSMNFFFLVKDFGSWLEIGTSISHFVIVMCMTLFVMLMFGLCHLLTSVKLFSSKTHQM